MSSLFYPSRHRRHQPYGYSSNRGLSPYYGHGGPVTLSTSPWASTGPFDFALERPFHQPFLSLFNDTFSQLDQLSNELNGYLNSAVANQDSQEGAGKNALAWAPKFDIKETDDAYVLEGEMPGIEHKNVSVEWADDNTMLVKGRTETYREEGKKPSPAATEASWGLPAAEADATKDTSTSAPATASVATDSVDTTAETNKDTAMTTTDTNKDVAKQANAQPTYHLTERMVGTFQRVFTFPGEVHHDNVKASLKNGLLTVTVPKVVKDTAETKKARNVEVEEVKDEADTVRDADKMQA